MQGQSKLCVIFELLVIEKALERECSYAWGAGFGAYPVAMPLSVAT